MFVVIEGLDGAGKSTQVKLLREAFAARGVSTEYLHFPRFEAPVYGELIARFLRGELGPVDGVDPRLVALLYAGDRQQAAPLIRGWLEEGKAVIVDRYVHSNIAYQCAKTEDPVRSEALRKWLLELEYGVNGIPRPDLALFLNVPFDFTVRKLTEQRTGDDRDYLQGKRDIHEDSLSLQEKVRNVYLAEAGKDPDFRIVECGDGRGRMLPPEDIFARIAARVF